MAHTLPRFVSPNTTAEGHQVGIYVPTYVVRQPYLLPVLPYFSTGGQGSSIGTPQQGCSRAVAGPTFYPGLLQPPLHSPEALGRGQAHYRPLDTQQVCPVRALSHGDFSYHPRGDTTGRVDLPGRPEGRLPSHPCTPGFPEVPAVLGREGHLPVQDPSIWSVGGSPYFHIRPQAHSGVAEREGHQGTCLSRRLARPVSGSGLSNVTRQGGDGVADSFGLGHQLEEVGPFRDPVSGLHRATVPTGPWQDTARSRSERECEDSHKQLEEANECDSSGLQLGSGQTETLGPVHSERPSPTTSRPILAERQMDTSHRSLDRPHIFERSDPPPPQMVGLPDNHLVQRRTTSPSPACTGPVHGRFHSRLGCIPGSSHSLRSLGPPAATGSYQPPGDESGFSGLQALRTPPEGEGHQSSYRQYDSGGSYPEGRGDKVVETDEAHAGATQLVRQAEHPVTSGPHRRNPERVGGLSLQDWSDPVERVVDLPQRVHESVLTVGDPDSRLDGNDDEQGSREVHFSDDSPCRSGSRRVQDPMATAEPALRLPATEHHPENPQSHTSERSPQDHRDSINDTHEVLPSGPPGDGPAPAGPGLQTGGHTATDPTHREPPAHPPRTGIIPVGGVASGGPKPSSNRLESIANVLRDQGYTERVIKFVQRPQRESTSGVYAHHWEGFVTFCRKDKINPLTASDANIADYLVYLFESRNLLVNTIKVHRAAIASVVKHSRPEVLQSTSLKDLIHRLELERPRVKRVYPKFDLDLVLRQFLKPPFVDSSGSDLKIPLKMLAYKTAFLLALATGARVSELHALSRHRSRFQLDTDEFSGQQTITVLTRPNFIAKNEKPSELKKPVIFSSLKHLYGAKEPERLLCPVRAAIVYKSRTPDGMWPADREELLRHPVCTQNVTTGHIAEWIKNAIKLTYEAANAGVIDCNAHEVRAVAHSLVAFSGASLEEVLEGGKWSSSGSFFRHYLRNMEQLRGKNVTVVAAGKPLQLQ